MSAFPQVHSSVHFQNVRYQPRLEVIYPLQGRVGTGRDPLLITSPLFTRSPQGKSCQSLERNSSYELLQVSNDVFRVAKVAW